jgi:hypothetical protein
MFTHNHARQPDQPWTRAAPPWVPESAPGICRRRAADATPVRAVAGGWDTAAALALLSVLLCGIAVVAAVHGLDQVLGAGAQRVRVCNRFDPVPATARCTVSDPFIVVHDGATSAALQIAVPDAASRPRVPVTIDVSETNGAGLVLATGRIRRVLQPDSAGVAVLPLQGVFAASRILLPATPAGSPDWERATYAVQVRDRTTILGETVFHATL